MERAAPPWEDLRVEERPASLEVGSRMVASQKGRPDKRKVVVRTAVDPGRSFQEEQQQGPFAIWVHQVRFHPRADGTCELEDSIEYELAAGVSDPKAAVRLARACAWRFAVLRSDLALIAKAKGPPRTVAITGASGLIGSALLPMLEALGHTVKAVRRMPDNSIAPGGLEGADAVVHLAGAGVADARWTPERKRLLVSSRVDFTARLVQHFATLPTPPKVLVSGSAIGVYGDRADEWVSEASEPGGRGPTGAGFLAGLCRDWEAKGQEAAALGTRVVLLRSGLVLTPRGGVLGRLLPVYRLGAGGRTGSGAAWMSWISIEDELRVIHHALFGEAIQGPLNAVAPRPVTGTEFADALGRVLSRPAVVPLPAFALRVAFGELADGALLSSQRVKPQVLADTGFAFEHPELEGALRALLGRTD